MKAFVYRGPGANALEDCPVPAIQNPGTALVRVVKATICGTNLHILKGDVPGWPQTLRGEAGKFYTRWEQDREPQGFPITARVLDFSRRHAG